jgi:hypothetical protein
VPVLPASFKVGDHVGRSGSDRSSPWFAASSDAAGTDGTAVYQLAKGSQEVRQIPWRWGTGQCSGVR